MENYRYKRYVLIVSTVGAFITPFMGSSLNLALPSMGEELAMDAVLLGWVQSAYLITIAPLLIPFGRLADIFGRKKIFEYGIFILTVSSLLCVFSTSALMLIIFRVLQGVGSAMVFGNSVAMLTSAYPPSERGKVLGINVAAVYSGLSAGPFIGGLITQHFGWKGIFIAIVPMCVITLVMSFWKIKSDWASSSGEKFDIIGSIFYCVALIAIMYGFTALPALNGVWFILAGFLVLVVFVKWAKSVQTPIFNIDLFRHNATFVFSNLAALINYSATFAIGFLLSLYLQYVKGFPPQTAGFILVAQPVTQAIFSPLAGKLSDKYEPRVLASIGMVLITIGLALFSLLNSSTMIAYIIAVLIMLGFGYALFSSPNTHAVIGSVQDIFYGVASAMMSTMRQIGMMFSMAIVMLLFTVFIGRVQITPEYYDSFLVSIRVAFIVFACLCFVGIFSSLARGKIRD